MDHGAGIDRIKRLLPKRELFVHHEEIPDRILITVQVEPEADALPCEVKAGDQFPRKTVAEELPDIVAGPAPVIEKRAGAPEHPGIKKMPPDPGLTKDRKNVGVGDATLFVLRDRLPHGNYQGT